jgi:hypothetical protein
MPHSNKLTVTQNKELMNHLDKLSVIKNQRNKEKVDTPPTKESIDTFIKNIVDDYNTNNCSSINFNGWNSLEIIKARLTDNNNPNEYIDTGDINELNNLRIEHKNNETFNQSYDRIYSHLTSNPTIPNSYIPLTNIPKIVKTQVFIDTEINTIVDLIDLIAKNPLSDTIEYNINMTALHKIHPSLVELNNMIGLKDMKNNVVDQLLYFIQGLHNNTHTKKTEDTLTNPPSDTENASVTGDFMHTVIYGPPGTGKTEVAKIMGQIFSNLGILKNGIFKKVTRSDLVAGYLGQTATKTRDVINECLGGVLFIDEAYALGNNEKRDMFAKECIDTLCEALSNHKANLMVIIAGYESELKDCFFSYNQGLDSRFTWRFKMDDYKGEELYKIFIKKVTDGNWSILEKDSDLINIAWFEKKLPYFKFFGRDIETLLLKTKIFHSRRVFCRPADEKSKITLKDLEGGFELYIKNEEVKNRKDTAHREYIMKSLYV